jgi:hypothetical protein
VGEGAYAGSCTKSGETCVLCIHAKVEVVQCMCVCVCVCVVMSLFLLGEALWKCCGGWCEIYCFVGRDPGR